MGWGREEGRKEIEEEGEEGEEEGEEGRNGGRKRRKRGKRNSLETRHPITYFLYCFPKWSQQPETRECVGNISCSHLNHESMCLLISAFSSKQRNYPLYSDTRLI